MTEDQAKEKWCPFARVVPGKIQDGAMMYGAPSGIAAHNRVQEPNENEATLHGAMSCLASGCTAWRWSRAKETKAYLDAVQEHMKATKCNFNVATNAVFADVGATFEEVEGYCGMAGKP